MPTKRSIMKEIMKAIVFSDIHWLYPEFKASDFPAADLAIFAGDWSGHGTKKETEKFAAWYSKLPCKEKFAVPGNHERYVFAYQEEAKSIFRDSGIKLLIDEPAMIGGRKFWGSPWCPGFGDWSWAFLKNEQELGSCFSKIPQDTEILITHCPPAGILDHGYGSLALRYALDNIHMLKLHIFGHIHSERGEITLDGLRCINASVLDDDYKRQGGAIEIEI